MHARVVGSSVGEGGRGGMSSKINILVVEDEFLIRMDLVDYLSGEGFEVFEAAHTDEAIAILEANDQIQVMFTDVDMPGSMDGLKLSAAVRDRWPPVRIVVTSGPPRGCADGPSRRQPVLRQAV